MCTTYSHCKRICDFAAALVGVLLLAPLFPCLAFLVRVFLGSPILFSQKRIGLAERPFQVYKFRTMTDARDGNGVLLPDEARLTNFGKFLRSTSLDELPQLWGVLKGDLSLVGPRPLLPEYLERYSARQRKRHEVLPGITGWAQVNGRNATTWADRLERDVWYVENQSFLLDLRILFMTFIKVALRSGVSAKGEATMRPFQGNQTTGQGGQE
jgi:lipopolysaccharide/colanic/teichoic acid biosynthesis glycosyltransferase